MQFDVPDTRAARILVWVIVLVGVPQFLFVVFEYVWIYQNPDFAIQTAQHPSPIKLKSDTVYVGPLLAWLDWFSGWAFGIVLPASSLLAWIGIRATRAKEK